MGSMQEHVDRLKSLYTGFNARDMESLLAAMHPNVVWANGMEGGYVYGREGVRGYWTRQWAMVDPHVEPVAFATDTEGEIVVEVRQIVHDLNGSLLLDRMVSHAFQIEEGFIKRFDIREM